MRTTKRLLAAIFTACMAAPALATEVQDTLVIEDANKVKIETRDTVQRIVINGMKGDPEFHYVQRISIPDSNAVRRTIKSVRDFNKITTKKSGGKESKWSKSWHVNIGLNTMLDAPDGYGVKVFPSFDLGIGMSWDWHPFGKMNEWSIGFGVDWRNYRMSTKDYYWGKDANNMSVLNRPMPTAAENKYVGMHVVSLQVPIMYTHYFNKQRSWGLSLGAIVNWNTGSRGNWRYDLGDEECDISLKRFGHRPFTVDGIVKVATPWLPTLYVKYCPMKFFRDDRGMEMHQLSFGICL